MHFQNNYKHIYHSNNLQDDIYQNDYNFDYDDDDDDEDEDEDDEYSISDEKYDNQRNYKYKTKKIKIKTPRRGRGKGKGKGRGRGKGKGNGRGRGRGKGRNRGRISKLHTTKKLISKTYSILNRKTNQNICIDNNMFYTNNQTNYKNDNNYSSFIKSNKFLSRNKNIKNLLAKGKKYIVCYNYLGKIQVKVFPADVYGMTNAQKKTVDFLQQLKKELKTEGKILYSEYDSKVAFDVTNCLKDNIILNCTEQTNYSPVLLENENSLYPTNDIYHKINNNINITNKKKKRGRKRKEEKNMIHDIISNKLFSNKIISNNIETNHIMQNDKTLIQYPTFTHFLQNDTHISNYSNDKNNKINLFTQTHNHNDKNICEERKIQNDETYNNTKYTNESDFFKEQEKNYTQNEQIIHDIIESSNKFNNENIIPIQENTKNYIDDDKYIETLDDKINNFEYIDNTIKLPNQYVPVKTSLSNNTTKNVDEINTYEKNSTFSNNNDMETNDQKQFLEYMNNLPYLKDHNKCTNHITENEINQELISYNDAKTYDTNTITESEVNIGKNNDSLKQNILQVENDINHINTLYNTYNKSNNMYLFQNNEHVLEQNQQNVNITKNYNYPHLNQDNQKVIKGFLTLRKEKGICLNVKRVYSLYDLYHKLINDCDYSEFLEQNWNTNIWKNKYDQHDDNTITQTSPIRTRNYKKTHGYNNNVEQNLNEKNENDQTNKINQIDECNQLNHLNITKQIKTTNFQTILPIQIKKEIPYEKEDTQNRTYNTKNDWTGLVKYNTSKGIVKIPKMCINKLARKKGYMKMTCFIYRGKGEFVSYFLERGNKNFNFRNQIKNEQNENDHIDSYTSYNDNHNNYNNNKLNNYTCGDILSKDKSLADNNKKYYLRDKPNIQNNITC